MPKFVASRSLQGPLDWNATLIEGDGAEGVQGLKGELDGDLFLIGCGELARNLLEQDVIDELRFWVHPGVWGDGERPVPLRAGEATPKLILATCLRRPTRIVRSRSRDRGTWG
jgi:dihydrofolate reductase